MFRENVKMSLRNIFANKFRSFLTVLGIIIGVASIISLISILTGVTDSIKGSFEVLGSNRVSITVTGTPSKAGLIEEDLTALSAIDNVSGVSPSVLKSVNAAYGNSLYTRAAMCGRSQVYFQNITNLLNQGRAITQVDCIERNRVCLVGQEVIDSLFFGQDPIGEVIIVGGEEFTIVGTLTKTGDFSVLNYNRWIIVPYTTAMDFMQTGYVTSLEVYIDDPLKSQSTLFAIDSLMQQMFNYAKTGFTITNMQDMLDMVAQISSLLTFALISIASISLVVGGIGIMNIMLVSVAERTNEIGLRKALGATPKIISQQFLLESIFLSVIGGILGIVFGIVIALIASIIIGSPFVLTFGSIALAMGFSMFIGIVFGYSPAKKASKMNPIDSLRSV